MSYLRPQHVFIVLMGLSAISAFLIPPQYTTKVVPQTQRLFAPISWPAGTLAAAIDQRVSPPAFNDNRKIEAVQLENQQLRNDVAVLSKQLEDIRRRDAELAKLGSAKDSCRLFNVIGGDTGTRDSLAINASTLEGVKPDQYVLYPGGLVGQVQRAGPGGAQVRLITDPSFRIRVRFGRFSTKNGKTAYEPLGTPIALAQGAGDGSLAVRLTFADIGYTSDGKPGDAATSLHDGSDYAVLSDPDCSSQLQGEMIGRVERITPLADARRFVQIRIQPTTNLKKLHEVMVMTKEN